MNKLRRSAGALRYPPAPRWGLIVDNSLTQGLACVFLVQKTPACALGYSPAPLQGLKTGTVPADHSRLLIPACKTQPKTEGEVGCL